MIIAVNVSGAAVGGGLGRAATMAVAIVDDGQVTSWQQFDVGWDVAHDQMDATGSGHGGHHATIVKFMREHQIEAVVAGHVGPPMVHTLGLMGIKVVTADGDAKQAAIAAVSAPGVVA